MVKSVKLFKGKENAGKAFSLGCSNNGWNLPDGVKIYFPRIQPFHELKEGEILNQDGSSADILAILQQIVKENKETVSVGIHGTFRKSIYGENNKWFIDYQPELKEFFEKNNLPIPADGKSIGERQKDIMLSMLEAQGLLTQEATSPAAIKVIEEASARLQAENERLKAELAKANKHAPVQEIQREEIGKKSSARHKEAREQVPE